MKHFLLLILTATLSGAFMYLTARAQKTNFIHHNENEIDQVATYFLERAQINLNLDLDSVAWYTNAVLFLGEQKSNRLETARALSIKGEMFQKQGDFTASISSFLKAIHIGEQNDFLPILGSAYNGLGITYYLMQDLKQAEQYIRKALDVKMKQKDYVYYSIIASNLAALLVYENKNPEALVLLKSAEQVALNNSLTQYLPNIYNSIGAIYFQMKNASDSALFYYKKTIVFAERAGIQQNVLTGYHNIGQLLLEKKQYDEALIYLIKSEQLSREMNSVPFQLKSVQTIGETYEAAGKIAQALEYRKREQDLNKQLFDSERQKAIEELHIQYETAKKDKINLAQERKILQGKLQAEQTKIKYYLLFFTTLLLVILASGIFYVLHQRRLNTEKINQEKIRIFENVVHDIRTPLTLIHGPLQELKSQFSESNKASQYFSLIERNSEKLTRLVNELLDVSKIDKGKYQIDYVEGDLTRFITHLIDDFQNEAQEKNISLQMSIDIPNRLYKFSSDILEKILSNLIGNALKYVPQNARVEVQAKIENQLLLLEVKDNGKGIPLKHHAKIFDRFYRQSEHEHLPGTGIGLAIVKDFVKMLKGDIQLTSTLNEGAYFKIQLPIEIAKEKHAADENASESKLHLLVCDDDEDIVTFVKSIFESTYLVLTASNGKEAIQIIEEQLPDMILSDVMMPEMDGLEFLSLVKSNVSWKQIPFVLFSAKASLESRLDGLQHGADFYLTKPFNPQELKLVLQNIAAKIEKTREEFIKQKVEKKTFAERLKSDNDYVNKATAFVIAQLENPLYSVNELAADMCISRSQLHRKLTLYTGHSATQFIRMIRLEKAKDLLESNFGNVEEIAFACGFGSRSYFSSSFAEYFGEAPTDVLRKV